MDLDRELEELKVVQDVDFDRLIESKINNRIRKIVLRTLGAVTTLVMVVVCGISPALNLVNVNPEKLNNDGILGEYESIEEPSTLHKTLSAWIETQFPYMELDYVDVEKKGFGCYDLNLHVMDGKDKIWVGGLNNVNMTMKRGKLEIANDPKAYMTMVFGKFATEEYSGATREEVFRDTVKSLPESAYLDIAVTLESPVSLESLKNNEVGACLKWIKCYSEGSVIQPGLSLERCVEWQDGTTRDKMTDKELKAQVVSNLQILIDNVKLWSGLSFFEEGKGNYIYSSDMAVKHMKEYIEKEADSDSLSTQMFCLSGSRDDILNFVNLYDIKGISVLNASLIRF